MRIGPKCWRRYLSVAVIFPNIRPATPQDAQSLCGLLNQIIETGGTTAHVNTFDRDRLFHHYIAPPFAISCLVAAHPERHQQLMGFQALEWADPNWQGVGKLPRGWAVIASFVAADCQGRGIGKALFKQPDCVPKTLGSAILMRQSAPTTQAVCAIMPNWVLSNIDRS